MTTPLPQVMSQMCAVLRAEAIKLTLAADEIESQFGCKEVLRQPEAVFAVQSSLHLRDALKDFPECWCDPITRQAAHHALDKAFQ